MRSFFLAAITASLLATAPTLNAQVILSQPIPKEVALALEQERQAASLPAHGRTAEADALYTQSLAAVERHPPQDPIFAGSLNNVAQFYRGQHRYAEAAELFNRALSLYAAAYGDNHTLTATVINNLGATYLADRQVEAAEQLYRRGLAATEKLLGPDHYAVAINLDWLAQAQFLQRRYPESEANLRRGIAIAEKSTGPASKLVVKLLDHLIAVVQAQGRNQEAAAIQERAQLIITSLRWTDDPAIRVRR